ncbi:GNAT family N-acetyltransferase [candidate division WOR-3 bacterium]|nr:GNAT family N-acetyltransferase [candidate division WOR-3 bacterium]
MLKNYPKEVILKNGEKVILRPMVKEDEKKLLEFFLKLPEEDRLFLKDDVTDPKVIKSWAENLNYEHVIPILAEIGDRIIGDATLHRRSTDQTHKTGEIRIVTDKDFRRHGLGTMLAKEIYYLALSLKFSKLVAEVIEDQHTVLKACESLGFRHETILKNQAIDLKGKKHNLIVLTEDVDALWKSIEDLIHKDTAHYSRG